MHRYLKQLLPLLTLSLLSTAVVAQNRDCDLYADAATRIAEETGFALLRWEPPTCDVDGN